MIICSWPDTTPCFAHVMQDKWGIAIGFTAQYQQWSDHSCICSWPDTTPHFAYAMQDKWGRVHSTTSTMIWWSWGDHSCICSWPDTTPHFAHAMKDKWGRVYSIISTLVIEKTAWSRSGNNGRFRWLYRFCMKLTNVVRALSFSRVWGGRM